ncbi:MAG: type II toxin-antitoxin system VapC family toxin [Planctomycetota bacterium]
MILLDTHAFVWLASDSAKLPAAAADAIRGARGHLFYSTISALEIAFLVRGKRLSLPLDVPAYLTQAASRHGITEIPVDSRIAVRSADLPRLHDDPFDRIILATAFERDLSLISGDRMISRYPGARVIWESARSV